MKLIDTTPVFTIHPTIADALQLEVAANGGAAIRVDLRAAAEWSVEPDEDGYRPITQTALVQPLVTLAGREWPIGAPLEAWRMVTSRVVSIEAWCDELLVATIQAVAAAVAANGSGVLLESEPASPGQLRFTACVPGTARRRGVLGGAALRAVLGHSFEHMDDVESDDHDEQGERRQSMEG